MRRIDINVAYDENNDTLYYQTFEIVRDLPVVGDYFHNKEVLSIEKMQKEAEQEEDEAYDFDCFKIVLKCGNLDDAAIAIEDAYIAISRTELNHMDRIVYIEGLPSSIFDANMLLYSLKKGHFAEAIKHPVYNKDNLIQSYFGISEKLWEKAVLSASGMFLSMPMPVTGFFNDILRLESFSEPGCIRSVIIGNMAGIELRGCVPYWWDESDALYISREDIKNTFIDRRYTVEDLLPDVFDLIVDNIEHFGDKWLHYDERPMWFDLISLSEENTMDIINTMLKVCYIPFKDFLRECGFTQARLSKEFRIPKRTIDDWCSGRNTCRTYLRILLAERIGIITRRLRYVLEGWYDEFYWLVTETGNKREIKKLWRNRISAIDYAYTQWTDLPEKEKFEYIRDKIGGNRMYLIHATEKAGENNVPDFNNISERCTISEIIERVKTDYYE